MSHLPCTKEAKRRKSWTFQCFTYPAILRIFKEFPILSNPEQTAITLLVFWFFSKIKISCKCNINTQNTHMNPILANYLNLQKIKLKYRYLKVLHKILQNFQSEHSINHLDLTLFETTLRKKPSKGVRKQLFGKRCFENL